MLKILPFFKDAFLGSEIDKRFKKYVKKSTKIPKGTYHITWVGQKGADLYYLQQGSNWWIDITTRKQAQAHFNKYNDDGYVTPYR